MFTVPLEPVEVSLSIKKLFDYGLTIDQIANSLQLGERDIIDSLNIYNLPDHIRELVLINHLEEAFIKQLLLLESPNKMEAAIRRYVNKRNALYTQSADYDTYTNTKLKNPLHDVVVHADKRIYFNTLYDTLKHLENCGIAVETTTQSTEASTITHIVIQDTIKADTA